MSGRTWPPRSRRADIRRHPTAGLKNVTSASLSDAGRSPRCATIIIGAAGDVVTVPFVSRKDTEASDRWRRTTDGCQATDRAGVAVRGLVACTRLSGAVAQPFCLGITPIGSGAAFLAQAALLVVAADGRAAADLARSRGKQPAVPGCLVIAASSRPCHRSICEACASRAAGDTEQQREDAVDRGHPPT